MTSDFHETLQGRFRLHGNYPQIDTRDFRYLMSQLEILDMADFLNLQGKREPPTLNKNHVQAVLS